MRILLIQPEWQAEGIGFRLAAMPEPLALELLAGTLGADHDVRILDMRVDNDLLRHDRSSLMNTVSDIEADLARVTAERDAQTGHAMELIDQLHEFKDQRDALLAAARDMLASAGSSLSASEIRKQEQREEARNGLISAVAACERAAIAACAPPASGEDKP